MDSNETQPVYLLPTKCEMENISGSIILRAEVLLCIDSIQNLRLKIKEFLSLS